MKMRETQKKRYLLRRDFSNLSLVLLKVLDFYKNVGLLEANRVDMTYGGEACQEMKTVENTNVCVSHRVPRKTEDVRKIV